MFEEIPEQRDDFFGDADAYELALSKMFEQPIGPKVMIMLQEHFLSPDHTISWQRLAEKVGYSRGIVVHGQLGRFAKGIGQQLGLTDPPKDFWCYVLAKWAGKDENGHQEFTLRRPVIDALKRLGHLEQVTV